MVRYQITRSIEARSPLAGEIIAAGTLYGDTPKECPSGKNAGGDREMNGSDPSYDELKVWIETVLLP
jgi:hypothetical protein